jgi:hypothetical protein
LVSVTKYVGVITEPRENSRYWPAPYVPKQNFFFNIQGRVAPVTEPGQTTVVDIDVPLCQVLTLGGPMYRFEAPLDENGQFAIQKSIVLPSFSPCCRVTLRICLESEGEQNFVPISEPVEFWFKPAQEAGNWTGGKWEKRTVPIINAVNSVILRVCE